MDALPAENDTMVSHLNVFQLGPLLKLVRQAQLDSHGRQGDLGLRHQILFQPAHI